MRTIWSTKEVATLLGVRVPRLVRAVYDGRLTKPFIGPGRAFHWTKANINEASRLFRKSGAVDILSSLQRGEVV